MLSDKQVLGLKPWVCSNCKITLGQMDKTRLVIRERGGHVVLDIHGATLIERKCSKCGTINQLYLQPNIG